MNIFQAVILSLVEGITEFLPISSTGHLVLASKILSIPQTEFVKSFEIVIQLGAILSVLVLYFKIFTKKLNILKNLIIAFIPTGVLGLVFYKIIKNYLLGSTNVVVISLLLGGILMIVLEKFVFNKPRKGSIGSLSSKKSFLIGFIQSFSMIPGISRAMATIFGGLSVGLTRGEATKFSFLLAVPTMAAAASFDLLKAGFSFSLGEYSILAVGFIGAFVSASLTVRFLISFVKRHNFTSFGIYRIILAVVFWLIFR